MALNNCTINSSSVQVDPSTQLGNSVANQVLTIRPDQGFRVAAVDFTNNTGTLPTSINSITIADAGTAYAADNLVLVTVDLKDTFNPGTSDHTVTIDIDGRALREQDIPKTIAGSYSVTVSDVTAVSASTYTASGSTGQVKDLFQITLAATSGHYFIEEPTVTVTTGDVANYIVTKTPNGTGTSFTSMVVNVDATIPAENVSGDVIAINARAEDLPSASNKITAYIANVDVTPLSFTRRSITVIGDPGATFRLQLKNNANQFFNFTTGVFQTGSAETGTITVQANGQAQHPFDFPTILADDDYDIEIIPKSPTTIDLSSSQSNPFIIQRRGFKKVEVSVTSTSRGSFTSYTRAYTDYQGNPITHTAQGPIFNTPLHETGGSDGQALFNYVVIIEDDQTFDFSTTLGNSLTLTESNLTETGNASLTIGTTTAAISNNQLGQADKRLTITGTSYYTNEFGSSDHSINFDIDDFTVAGGSNSGNSNVLLIGTTRFADITNSGFANLIFPDSQTIVVTGRTANSTSVVYNFSNITISRPDLPLSTDTQGEVTVAASPVAVGSSAKFRSNTNTTYTVAVSSVNFSNLGDNSLQSVTVAGTLTVANFTPAVASGDQLQMRLDFTFADLGQNP